MIKIANDYNLNDDKSNSCLNDEKLEDKILEERINGDKKYSIKSTPTVLINEKKNTKENIIMRILKRQ